jgi:hypothetical protein
MPRSEWPPYRTVRELLHSQAGRTAVIVGGGCSLNKWIAAAPREALYISVNDHGTRLFKDRPELARACELIVACDFIEERARADVGRHTADKGRDAKPWGLPVVSTYMWADYRLLFMPGPSSGMAAAFIARLLGCSPILLLGMDCFAGGTYYDDPHAQSTGHDATATEHLNRWRTLLEKFPAQYRTMGCYPALRELCGVFDPREARHRAVDRAQLERELTSESARMRLLRDTLISMRPFTAGSVLELHRNEATKLINKRLAARVKPGDLI